MERKVPRSKYCDMYCSILFLIYRIFIFTIELLRDGFGAEKYFHVLLAELKDPPPSKQEGIHLATEPNMFQVKVLTGKEFF